MTPNRHLLSRASYAALVAILSVGALAASPPTDCATFTLDELGLPADVRARTADEEVTLALPTRDGTVFATLALVLALDEIDPGIHGLEIRAGGERVFLADWRAFGSTLDELVVALPARLLRGERTLSLRLVRADRTSGRAGSWRFLSGGHITLTRDRFAAL